MAIVARPTSYASIAAHRVVQRHCRADDRPRHPFHGARPCGAGRPRSRSASASASSRLRIESTVSAAAKSARRWVGDDTTSPSCWSGLTPVSEPWCVSAAPVPCAATGPPRTTASPAASDGCRNTNHDGVTTWNVHWRTRRGSWRTMPRAATSASEMRRSTSGYCIPDVTAHRQPPLPDHLGDHVVRRQDVEPLADHDDVRRRRRASTCRCTPRPAPWMTTLRLGPVAPSERSH